MELILAIIFLVAFIIFWWYYTIPSNLPPGPEGLPFLGSALETCKASTILEKLSNWKAKYGSLYKLYIGEKLVIVLADWNTIQEALVKQADIYVGRPTFYTILLRKNAGMGILDSEGELWKIQRRFALSTLRDFGFGRPIIEPRIKHEAEFLIEAMQSHGVNAFDPATILQNAGANVISALVFGRRFDYEDESFYQVLKIMRSRLSEMDVSFMAPFVLSKRIAKLVGLLPQFYNMHETNNRVSSFFRDQTIQALSDFNLDKGDEPTNYVQAFYKTQREDGNWTFTDDQLVASVGNLFIAGTDTTATTLRWAIFYMALYPELQEKVYEEIRTEFAGNSLLNYADRTKLPYTGATILEVQRLGNVFPIGVMRRTTAPSTLCGYSIPEDTIVVPFLTSVLWDEKVFPNPHVFDPSRFLDGVNEGKAMALAYLMPFQTGKRICLGESLAKMVLFIFFTAMISKFRFYFPDDKQKHKPALLSVFRTPPQFMICAEKRSE